MPAHLGNPRDVFLALLSEVLFMERLAAFEVLPDLIQQAADGELTAALDRHLVQTRAHAENVEAVFRAADAEPGSAHSRPFAGLKDQHAEQAGAAGGPDLADVLHAHAAAQTERYELGAYAALLALAPRLVDDEAVARLEANRREEEDALGELQRVLARLAGVVTGPTGGS